VPTRATQALQSEEGRVEGCKPRCSVALHSERGRCSSACSFFLSGLHQSDAAYVATWERFAKQQNTPFATKLNNAQRTQAPRKTMLHTTYERTRLSLAMCYRGYLWDVVSLSSCPVHLAVLCRRKLPFTLADVDSFEHGGCSCTSL
jgi:hypothetical protein